MFGMSSLSLRRNVLFDNNVIVFMPTDWPADVYRNAWKGCWMRAALYQKRFERRIEISERILGTILSVEHRERICCR